MCLIHSSYKNIRHSYYVACMSICLVLCLWHVLITARLLVYVQRNSWWAHTSFGKWINWVPTVFRFPFSEHVLPSRVQLWTWHTRGWAEQKNKKINKKNIPLFNLWPIWSVPQHLPALLCSLTRVETCIACLLGIYKAWNKQFNIYIKYLLFQTLSAWSRGWYARCLLAHKWKLWTGFAALPTVLWV